jgi:hypothetical protein
VSSPIVASASFCTRSTPSASSFGRTLIPNHAGKALAVTIGHVIPTGMVFTLSAAFGHKATNGTHRSCITHQGTQQTRHGTGQEPGTCSGMLLVRAPSAEWP